MKYTFLFIVFFFIQPVVKAQNLSALTYNIKYDNPSDSLNNWEARKEFLISQINFYSPDVFGTQEGLINQLDDIELGLDNYKFIGVGRDEGDEQGEFSAIFYNSERLELLSHDTFWLSETPSKPSKGWDAALNRICTYGVFKQKQSNKKIMVFNTHFDHVGKMARKKSVDLIIEKIKILNKDNYPVILTGDFNLEPESKPIQNMITVLNDAYILAGENAFGPEGTFNGFDYNKPVKRRIDYIFISPGDFKVLKSAILSDSKNLKFPSDHFPVYAKLQFLKE